MLLRMALDWILASIFKVLVPIFEGKRKMYHELLFLQKKIDVLIIDVFLNLKDVFSALVRIRKKDLYVFLARKQQECRERTPLK